MGRRRGFFAQLERMAREAERAQRQRQREIQRFEREMARLEKLEAKEREREEAHHAVAEYENKMELLTSVHRQVSPPIDWSHIATSEAPVIAATDTSRSDQVRLALEAYRPSFFEKLLGTYKGRKRLETDLEQALAREAEARQEQEREYQEALAYWQESVDLARRVLAGEHGGYDEVIQGTECFEELLELGCNVAVEWHGTGMAVAAIHSESSAIVPATVKSLTKTGKLSSKNMPKTLFWETYQDFVCGAALRAAREILAVLPIETVLVNVGTSLFNSATGHDEQQIVLSVRCVRERMEEINFSRADASDVTESFVHIMKFRKGKGMQAIEPLDPEQNALASP